MLTETHIKKDKTMTKKTTNFTARVAKEQKLAPGSSDSSLTGSSLKKLPLPDKGPVEAKDLDNNWPKTQSLIPFILPARTKKMASFVMISNVKQ